MKNNYDISRYIFLIEWTHATIWPYSYKIGACLSGVTLAVKNINYIDDLKKETSM